MVGFHVEVHFLDLFDVRAVPCHELNTCALCWPTGTWSYCSCALLNVAAVFDENVGCLW